MEVLDGHKDIMIYSDLNNIYGLFKPSSVYLEPINKPAFTLYIIVWFPVLGNDVKKIKFNTRFGFEAGMAVLQSGVASAIERLLGRFVNFND